MSTGDRKHYTPHDDLVDLAAATRDLIDVNTALQTEIKEAIEALTVEMVTTKIEIVTDQCPALEINHSGTDSCKVIQLTPTEALTAASSWYAMYMSCAALDPLGAGCDLHGMEIDFSAVDLTNNPDIQGLAVKLPAAYAGGTEMAGYFAGDGRTVSLCTDSYALDISGAMNLAGAVIGITTLSMSGNLTVGGTVDGVDVAGLKTDVDGFQDGLKDLTAIEVTQLKNIGISTISGTQWGYLGAFDQGLTQASSPTFADVTVDSLITAGNVDGVDVSDLKDDVDGFHDELKDLAQAEIQQLENIGATTISDTQWGYLGALDQTLIQAASPTFVGLTLSGAITGLTDLTMTGAISEVTTLLMSGQLTNTLAIGNPPFVITSTTVVPNLNVDQVDGYDFDQAVLQASSPTFVGLTLSGAIATPTNISMTGELDLTGVDAKIDLNPAGSGIIIGMTPSAAMTGGANWYGIAIDGAALDPADAGTEIRGLNIILAGVDMTNNPSIYGIAVTLPVTYGTGTERAGHFSGAGRTVIICESANAIKAIGTSTFEGEVNIDGTTAAIDLNPAGTGSKNIIDITASAALVADSDWTGIKIVGNALDPATGASCNIYGFYAQFNTLVSADNDAAVYGFRGLAPSTENSYMFSQNMSIMTVNKEQRTLFSYMSGALNATATYQGVFIDWDAPTRTGGAPVLQGVRSQLPADYTDFGTSYAGYFSGDGRSVYLCDTTYALNIAGAMLLNGVITGVNSITLDAGVTVTEFSIDDTLAGDSDAALPTEQAVKAYVDNHSVIASGNAEWINCPLESWNVLAAFRIGGLSTVYNEDGTDGEIYYSVPLPTTRGGLKLYISATRVSVKQANETNFVSRTDIVGQADATASYLDSDHTDKNSADLWEDDSMGAVDCSGQHTIKTKLECVVDTAGQLAVQFVTVRYYYAA